MLSGPCSWISGSMIAATIAPWSSWPLAVAIYLPLHCSPHVPFKTRWSWTPANICLTVSLTGQNSLTWPLLPTRKLTTYTGIVPAFPNLGEIKSQCLGQEELAFFWFLPTIFFFSKLKQKKMTISSSLFKLVNKYVPIQKKFKNILYMHIFNA